LQFFQESGGVRAVHLGVMKLEGDGQSHFEPMLAISAPRQEWVGVDAALPMHQQSSMLNFSPRRRLTLQSRVTSKVFVSVTIGMGDFIHSSKAVARLVSLGLTSCFILIIQ
jgi:hypothetical protein